MEKRAEKNIKKIVLIGAESTGKTELAEFLAKKFNTVFVPEYAREYIEKLGRKYTYEDVEYIAAKQIELEEQYLEKAQNVLFYDTYLIITKIWFKLVFHKVPHWLERQIRKCNIDLFLLCNNELPWIPDLVRENGGEMRDRLFNMYKEELTNYDLNYQIVQGKDEERFNSALYSVENFLNQK